MYTDPSGEFLVEAIIIGTLIAGATYTLTALLADVPFSIGGLAKSMFIGAASAAVTFGIGSGAENLFTNFFSRAAFQALAHGTFQGGMTAISGGKFWSGFAAGAISSIAASAWSGGDTGQWQGIGGKFADSGAGMIAFGTVSGGAGAALTKGNFWQGAVTGLVVSGLNHYVHTIKVNRYIDKRLQYLGKDPDAQAQIGQSEIKGFTEDMFPSTLEKTGDVGIRLVDQLTSLNGESAYGRTLPTNDYKNILRIEISKSALSSWRLLASTIGHELNHAYHFISGSYNNWAKKYGHDYASARSEYISQHWEYINGGVPSMDLMKEKYKIMKSYE